MIRPLHLLIAVPFLCSAAPQPATGTVVVEVPNVRSASGVVHVDICTEKEYLGDNCSWSGEAPAQPGTTRVTVANVPPGRYAAQIFFDENHNGKVDRGLFGIPKEGVGFSNDAPIGLSAPSFKNAMFTFDGGTKTIRITLRYYTGAKGPPAAR